MIFLLILVSYVAYTAKYLTYLLKSTEVIQIWEFDNLHMTQRAKIIVGFMTNVGNVFYPTFTDDFLFSPRFLLFLTLFISISTFITSMVSGGAVGSFPGRLRGQRSARCSLLLLPVRPTRLGCVPDPCGSRQRTYGPRHLPRLVTGHWPLAHHGPLEPRSTPRALPAPWRLQRPSLRQGSPKCSIFGSA